MAEFGSDEIRKKRRESAGVLRQQRDRAHIQLARCLGLMKAVAIMIPRDSKVLRHQGVMEMIWETEELINPGAPKWQPRERS